MKLALFTPGAYVWPVERSFEGFIHSLGGWATDADNIVTSTAYPADSLADHQAEMPAELSTRLVRLHRDLYDALLLPVEHFRGSQATLGERFYPDLIGTQADALVNALMFFFTRYAGVEITVPRGLAVLRAVFFNHESADPALWLFSSLERLKAERNPRRTGSITIEAPAGARVQGLAFALVGARDLPPSSPRMIIGEARQSGDGRILVKAEYGLDPSTETESAAQRAEAGAMVTQCVAGVFGWRGVQAA
jgi:hypothetical protein